MSQKFGNARWVQEGFLDNRVAGTVVGRVSFAVFGAVDFYLAGDFKGEIAGKMIRFRNPRFVDEDLAAQVLGELEIPMIGDVNLISFDPHPNLAPHPYIEWFSTKKHHYRIELSPGDAWIALDREVQDLDPSSRAIRRVLEGRYPARTARVDSEWV
jgi:hypothetical protein